MAELAGDDGDVRAFGAELGGMRVAEAVGVDAPVDASPNREAFKHDTDAGGGHPVTAERAEDRVAAAQAEAAPGSRATAVPPYQHRKPYFRDVSNVTPLCVAAWTERSGPRHLHRAFAPNRNARRTRGGLPNH